MVFVLKTMPRRGQGWWWPEGGLVRMFAAKARGPEFKTPAPHKGQALGRELPEALLCFVEGLVLCGLALCACFFTHNKSLSLPLGKKKKGSWAFPTYYPNAGRWGEAGPGAH